jgi:antirestriction protein
MIHANDTPRVYAACLASYNAGTLHGEWIDAVDADELREGIAEMLRESPNPNVTIDCPDCPHIISPQDNCTTCNGSGKVRSAEEWAFHDNEGWGEYPVSEHADIDDLAELGRCIEEHGEAFAAYAGNIGGDADEAGFEEAYCGEWDSEEAYAEDTMDDLYDIPDHLVMYIDWEAVARDWFCGDYYSIDGGAGIYVFRNC